MHLSLADALMHVYDICMPIPDTKTEKNQTCILGGLIECPMILYFIMSS